MRIKGLLEMMFDVLSDWIDQFISDMEARFSPFPCAHWLFTALQQISHDTCLVV